MMVEIIALGGWVIVVLLAFSVAALSVAIYKGMQFFSAGIWRNRRIDNAMATWAQGERAQGLDQLSRQKSAIANVLKRAGELYLDSTVHNDRAREESLRLANDLLFNLREHLRVLEVVAALSPLLGLLGTVLGMIDAFQEMQLAGQQIDPSALSGGIWQALLTTAAGLCVAIPAVVLLNWFEQQIERCRHYLENGLTLVFSS